MDVHGLPVGTHGSSMDLWISIEFHAYPWIINGTRISMDDPVVKTGPIGPKTGSIGPKNPKKPKNPGYNNYGIFWQFYGEITFK